jgi:hypothetical protein
LGNLIRDALQVAVEEGPSWGIFLNLTKFTLWWPTYNEQRGEGFPEGMKQSRVLGVRFLGVPLSCSREYVSAYVEEKAREVGEVVGKHQMYITGSASRAIITQVMFGSL